MNDVVVSRSSRAGMIELQVHVDGVYMYNQRADGLIVATPTGSTAYALSANGPILHPRVAGIVLVPVAPQALSNRPITLPDDVRIAIRVVDGREPRVAADMQVFSDLQLGDDIIIERAPFMAHFLHPVGYSYWAKLRLAQRAADPVAAGSSPMNSRSRRRRLVGPASLTPVPRCCLHWVCATSSSSMSST
jgi:NAD+ kinase